MSKNICHNARRNRLIAILSRGRNGSASGHGRGITPRIIIYKSEFEYMAKCIMDRNNIETGGQLFGHWTSDGVPIILYAIGPGPRANHQLCFFNQDIDYLVKVGRTLRSRFGLHHIGEWHSHHQLGLDRPSQYDVKTMTTVIRHKGLARFLLCIGTCTPNEASVRGFLCDVSTCSTANWDVIPFGSPIRQELDLALSDELIDTPSPNREYKTHEDYGQRAIRS